MTSYSSTSGQLNKIIIDDYLYKGNSINNTEPENEVLACILAKIIMPEIEIIEYVLEHDKYNLNQGSYKYVSKCKIYNNTLYEFGNIFEKYYCGDNDINSFLLVYTELGLSETWLYKILAFDAFIGNEDRHLNNIHIIQVGENEYKNGPLMDFGKSFKSDYSKPFKNTHSEQIKLIPTGIKLFNYVKYTDLKIPNHLDKYMQARYEKYLLPFMQK